jgi:hypothetical protein
MRCAGTFADISGAVYPKNSSWPTTKSTTKSTKNARKGTWERDGLHPPGERARLPNRLVLFVFFVFSVVKLLGFGL